eukprot:2053518-Prymnesium_polylepis.2
MRQADSQGVVCVRLARTRSAVGDRGVIAGGAAEPVASAKPVSIVQNASGDLLDGEAEPHHLNDNAGDRAGSLDDDEHECAAGRVRAEVLGGVLKTQDPGCSPTHTLV